MYELTTGPLPNEPKTDAVNYLKNSVLFNI